VSQRVDGLVGWTICPIIPPRVDYELTNIGRTLIEPLMGWLGNIREAPAGRCCPITTSIPIGS
jgi:DNA-binding HxlR family transcriptional regulator